LPVLPYLSLLAAFAVVRIFSSQWLRGVVVAGYLLSFVLTVTGQKTGYDYENDMQYMEVVSTHLAACRFVEKNFQGKKIMADWPLSTQLQYPYLGYVSKPLSVVSPEEYCDILILSPQSANRGSVARKIAQDRNMSFIKKFEINDKFVEIYVAPGRMGSGLTF
jgi:hypothetical protein